ncbi:MAG: hypothetical protein IR527_00595 [Bacteroides sp.]|nr:MAG: hypothetical protein IR527_00595 [Bacteroides sp.]
MALCIIFYYNGIILNSINNDYNSSISINNKLLLLPLQLKEIKQNKQLKNFNYEVIDFYQGFKYAIINKNFNDKIKLHLYIYDTDIIDNFFEIKNYYLDKIDIIICPYYFNNIDVINDFSIKNNIYFFSPLKENNLLKDNYNNIFLNYSFENISNNIIQFIKKNFASYMKILILIDNNCQENFLLKLINENNILIDSFIIEADGKNISKIDLIFNDNNENILFILLSEDYNFWKIFFSYLDFMNKKNNITINYSIITSTDISTMPPAFINKAEIYNTYLFSNNIVNNKIFLKDYKKYYNVNPSNASVNGYDIANIIFKYFFYKNCNTFSNNIQENFIGLKNNILFYFDTKKGFINESVKIFKVKNYKLIENDLI